MCPEALKLLKGTLHLDPAKRFTALDCLAQAWFDDLREPEIDRLIEAHNQLKLQQMQMENLSALNQYQNNQRHDMKRGESSKSRASVRSTNQYAAAAQQSSNHQRGGMDDMQPAYTMTNSKNTIYNSKYNLRTDQTSQNVKGTP